MIERPTLVVVSGPPGAGKTTLAHAIARAVGCPAICRDEIKEGMVHATSEFLAGPGDELTRRTLPTFFHVLEVLLGAGATTVAEAAFQDRVWRPRLESMRGLAHLRIVQCSVDASVAWTRIRRRQVELAPRRAHGDSEIGDVVTHAMDHNRFDRISLEAPSIEVDTADGYQPGLGEIVAFVNSGH